jgi:4-alpha-glucanotransferase
MNTQYSIPNPQFSIQKAAGAFLGLRSLGLFAPLSYWRSRDDWGIGDLDVLLEVIEFAKKTRVSVLSLLPLNIPLFDNCPYANASAYIFDPVYIGMNRLIKDLGLEQDKEISAFIDSAGEKLSHLRNQEKSSNDEIRSLKYEALRRIFKKFQENELRDQHSEIADILIQGRTWKTLNSQFSILNFKAYCLSNEWLGDHLLFFILAKKFGTDDFRFWPKEIALRSPQVIKELKQSHKDEILFGAFLQWILTEQLNYARMKAGKGEFKVDLMLDQPFAFGSADVWRNLDAFVIDPQTLKREYTQGAPPHRLDIPQHWQFYLLNMENPAAKKLLTDRLSFFLKFCDLLRIDHLLGYYRLYCLTEDTGWEMTLEKMGVWDEIQETFEGRASLEDKRNQIYDAILKGIRNKFPQDVLSRLFDESGTLKPAHVILGARRLTDDRAYDHTQCGWYRQPSIEHGQDLLYTLLSPNQLTNKDYLKKIIAEKEMFLCKSDSIRLGFFKMGLGEEIISHFMAAAQEQGKILIFEKLGVIPDAVTRSLQELGAWEFKPLIFGYQYFAGDPNEFWFDRITPNNYVCFSTQDTVTLRGWWEGKESWAKKKYYFRSRSQTENRDEEKHQKQEVLDWLVHQGYLSEDTDADTDVLSDDLLRAVLYSVADAEGKLAVMMMSNIFGSGDEGIINMPGHFGFWTARSPISIEDLTEAAENPLGKQPEDIAANAVARIKFLASTKERDSFLKQIQSKDSARPHILTVHSVIGEGSKQLRFQGQAFLIDAVVYGKCGHVSVVFEDGSQMIMQELNAEAGLFPGIRIFRAYIPSDAGMSRVSPFQIALDGNLQPEKGYLIGCPAGTDMNPLSEHYGKVRMQG